MKKILLLFLLAVSLNALAQIDVKDFNRFRIGLMYDRTNIDGAYLKYQGSGYTNTGSFEKSMSDYSSCKGYELSFIQSDEKGVQYANFEGLIWIMGHILKYSHNNDYDLFIDRFTAGPIHNIPGSGSDVKFMNNHLLDYMGSFGQGTFCAGFNVGMRILGLPAGNTTYVGKNPDGSQDLTQLYMSSSSGVLKMAVGANLCYRKAFGENSALICFAGVNTLPHLKSSSYSLNIKYNPFISPTLYFGKEKGLYTGLYYEWMKGTARPAISLTDGKDKLDFSENQIQVKLGISFKSKRFL